MTFSLEEAIIVMFFISCLDSHSDGTHSLQKIHWRGSDLNVSFLRICSDEETNLALF